MDKDLKYLGTLLGHNIYIETDEQEEFDKVSALLRQRFAPPPIDIDKEIDELFIRRLSSKR